MWYFSYLTSFFAFFPTMQSLLPGYVIKDAVDENHESDQDSW